MNSYHPLLRDEQEWYLANASVTPTIEKLFFTAIVEQQLNWTQNNQDTLRVYLYHNLCDVVISGDTSAAGLGKRIVLPRTYIGSPRYMMHNYQDAMALCRTYGNPDLFITFTSNPKWPEIAEMLAYIQVVYGIEFQKRGLLHAHILLWLKEEFKCRTPDQINDIILAELPCPRNDPDAYKVVSEFMLHGPCGAEAKHAPCTNEGKCSKYFPKKFLAETIINEDGYPVYHCRDNKITAVKGKFTYDNKHVVPHNQYLLLKYHAHINVEWYNRSKAIKYLFKYLNKGPDRATISIQENVKAGADGASDQIMIVDEIKNYLNCRFLSPCEAVWRARSFTELKMVNKITYATFKVACFAYGLLNDDKEWTHTIAEASFWVMAPQLRDLFVTILYPKQNLSDEQVRNYCLLEIQDLLNTHGKSLTDFKYLPQPNPKLLKNLDNRLLREALPFDANKRQFCFIHGPGGTRKTFLYKTITARLRSEQMIVLAVATSGDFQQIMPVIPNAKRPEVIQACINQSELWKYCKVMGNYQLKKESKDEPTWIEIPKEFLIKSWTSPIEQIIAETQRKRVKKIRRAPVTYNSVDEIYKASTDTADQQDLYPVEFLNSLNFPGMPPCPLLKKGTPNNAHSEYKPKSGHGQLYVALSKVTSPDGLKILMIEDEDKEFKNHTRNIVFKEAFNNVS
ncbi:ATP-dependent DNA helicase PIF1-like protein [Tanacetum coccineum]